MIMKRKDRQLILPSVFNNYVWFSFRIEYKVCRHFYTLNIFGRVLANCAYLKI